jgi:hypothetical protein
MVAVGVRRPEMSGDCGVVEADVECAMFALTTPVLQGEEEMKGIELRAETGMMASGLNSALKGTTVRLDPWRKAAEAARRCGSVER